jgi:hypothetical protein
MIRKLRTLLFIIIFIAPTMTFAGHIAGASMSYLDMGGNQYEVSVRIYRDCQGLPLTNTIPVCYSSADSNYYSTELAAIQSVTQLPPFPYLPPMTTSCNGGPGYGIECVIYTTVIYLPFAAADWEFSWTAIGVLQTPVYSNFLVTTQLNNLDFPGNNAAAFTFNPVFLYCIGQPAYDNLVATDADGDSLVYSLLPLLTGNDNNCPAIATLPYPQSIFPPSAVAHTIHPTNGWVYFEPNQVGQAFMHIKVEEYRNGVSINETTLWHYATVVPGCTVTAINDNIDMNFSIAPNPVLNELHIQSPAMKSSVEVIDAMGKSYLKAELSATNGEYILNVENIQAGIYFVRVNDGINNKIFKFLKD